MICIFLICFIYSIHIIQVFSFVCVLTWSLLGVKKSLDHAQIGLLWGFNSKFPTSIPTPFICRVPSPPRYRVQKVLKFAQQISSPGKSLENGDKVLSFFSKAAEIFFILVKSYWVLSICLQRIMEKALFLYFLRSLLIIYLITLSLEK